MNGKILALVSFDSLIKPAKGVAGTTPLAISISPLMELEPRGKNKRVRRYETQQLVIDLKASGQPVPSEVRSSVLRYGLVFW